MRLLFPSALLLSALLAVGAGDASVEDNGERLFQIFETTCAAKPVSGEALDARARPLGYVHQQGPVLPDDLSRNPDDIHGWKLPDQGTDFALSAYFTGRRDNYRVVCGIHADGVDFPALVVNLSRVTTLAGPRRSLDSETGKLTDTWAAETGQGNETLDAVAYKNGRVSVTLSYDVIKR